MYANQREGPAFVIMPNNAFASQDQNLIHSFKKTPVLGLLSSLLKNVSEIWNEHWKKMQNDFCVTFDPF